MNGMSEKKNKDNLDSHVAEQLCSHNVGVVSVRFVHRVILPGKMRFRNGAAFAPSSSSSAGKTSENHDGSLEPAAKRSKKADASGSGSSVSAEAPSNYAVIMIMKHSSDPLQVFDTTFPKNNVYKLKRIDSTGKCIESWREIVGSWDGPGGAFIRTKDNCIYKLTLERRDGSQKLFYRLCKIIQLPDGCVEAAVEWSVESGFTCACFVRPKCPKTEGAPVVVYPLTVPNLLLKAYDSFSGWHNACFVPGTSETLRLQGGRCAWRVMSSPVPEEGERGEFYTIKLWSRREAANGNTDENQMSRFTEGAGRVGVCLPSPNGMLVAYSANFSASNPITTHLDLRVADLSAPTSTANHSTLLGPQVNIAHFGWVNNEVVWATIIVGVDVVTSIIHVKSGEVKMFERPPICMDVPTQWWNNENKSVECAFVTEGEKSFPAIWTGYESLSLNQALFAQKLAVTRVSYESNGETIRGLVYVYERAVDKDKPILVHIHGGPAIAVPSRRRDAADASRYPYRHLLISGFRIFAPLYRGTLGFGDAFAKALIKKQGLDSGDLGDIINGIAHLRSIGFVSDAAKVGIFGGSYGGYLTLRALALHPNVFSAAVCMWPYVHNRFMTYEGGDSTWENEYIGDSKVWPEVTTHDAYQHLHKIKTPTLFVHGQDDDICPVSQSIVSHRIIAASGVPTELRIYADEKHGMENPEKCEDRDLSVLAWFKKHMGPAKVTKLKLKVKRVSKTPSPHPEAAAANNNASVTL